MMISPVQYTGLCMQMHLRCTTAQQSSKLLNKCSCNKPTDQQHPWHASTQGRHSMHTRSLKGEASPLSPDATVWKHMPYACGQLSGLTSSCSAPGWNWMHTATATPIEALPQHKPNRTKQPQSTHNGFMSGLACDTQWASSQLPSDLGGITSHAVCCARNQPET